MSRVGRIEFALRDSSLAPPPQRRGLGLAMMAIGAVAILSFAIGLTAR